MNDVEQKLMTARALTATTGVMHDIQVAMIKNWGAVAFIPFGKGSWTASPDPVTKTVAYKIKSKKRKPSDLPRYIASLDVSIHWLLGDDWATEVHLNGKLLYRGSRKQNTNEQRHARNADSGGRSSSK